VMKLCPKINLEIDMLAWHEIHDAT
jgi:hypothetical protein